MSQKPLAELISDLWWRSKVKLRLYQKEQGDDMPTVVKQTTNGSQVVAQQAGASPLAGAVSATRMKRGRSKVVLYGRNGIGKTTLAALFPKPLLFATFEPRPNGGCESIRGTSGVTVLPVTSKAQAHGLAKHLAVDQRSNWKIVNGELKELIDQNGNPVFSGDPWDTHVVDSGTSLQDMVLKELMGLDRVPIQMNWGSVPQGMYQDRSAQAKEILQLFLELNSNTVVICLEKNHNRQEGERGHQLVSDYALQAFFAADMGEATVKWMQNSCDYIVHLSIVPETKEVVTLVEVMPGEPPTEDRKMVPTGRLIRRLRTLVHPNFSARMCSPIPENVPDYIDCQKPQEMYDDMTRVMRGERAIHGFYRS